MNLTRMIRPALLALAAVAVSGCVTYPGYRHGGAAGDYYYGQPSVEYRYRDYGPWHGGYGYPYYGGSRLSIGISYGYPYGYGYGYPYGYGYHRYGHGYPWYGWPYYGYPYYRPRVERPPVHRPPPGDGGGDGGGRHDDDRDPPWRDLGGLDDLRGRRPIDAEPLPPRRFTGGVTADRPAPPRTSEPVRPRMERAPARRESSSTSRLERARQILERED
ncbi:hypothetical protein GCM10028862_23400 [Luteimonas pelagia]